MRLYGVLFSGICPEDKQVHVYTREYEVSSFGFFAQGTVKDTFKFVCREALPTLKRGTRHVVTHETYVCYMLMSERDDIGVFAFCDSEYPRRVAFDFLKASLMEFEGSVRDTWKTIKSDDNLTLPNVKKLFAEYQDPRKVDSLSAAKDSIEKTQVVMHENIQKLLENQGTLDDLVLKSKDFSEQSKMFYKQSKKMNRCCSLI
jgi:synaptobrevin family protein YKT6